MLLESVLEYHFFPKIVILFVTQSHLLIFTAGFIFIYIFLDFKTVSLSFEMKCSSICVVLWQLLGVELISVLHRLLLTWNPSSVQLLVTGVVQQIVRAAQDYLQEKRNTLSKHGKLQELKVNLI